MKKIKDFAGILGEWWILEDPSIRYAGVIEFTDKKYFLSISSFEESQPINPNEFKKFKNEKLYTWCGIINGKAISLLNAFEIGGNYHNNYSLGHSWQYRFQPLLIAIGNTHIDETTEFDGINFTTNHLLKLIRTPPTITFRAEADIESIELSSGSTLEVDEFLKSQQATYELPNLNLLSCDLGPLGGSLSFQYSSKINFDACNGTTTEYEPCLLVELDVKQTSFKCIDLSNQISRLLSLLTLTPNYSFNFSMFQRDELIETWDFFENKEIIPKDKIKLNHLQIGVTVSERPEMLKGLFPAWFDSMENCLIPRWIFQNTLECGNNTFDINRFLNVMQALEILSDLHCQSTKLPKNEFSELCDRLAEAFIDDVDNNKISSALNALRANGNRLPLSIRINELAEKLDKQVLVWLFGDYEKSLRLAVSARNYFTHYGDITNSKKDLFLSNLSLLTCKLSVLYMLVELQILGFPLEKNFVPYRNFPEIMRIALNKNIQFSC
ncbi:MAG: HEPN domain-containing protein [Rhodomicrobiaceae bacterium]